VRPTRWTKQAASLCPGRHADNQIVASNSRTADARHPIPFTRIFTGAPSNIMIDRLGTVKIIDFGRAVSTGSDLYLSLLVSPRTRHVEPLPAA